tara:strand:+ start:1419 stop:2507 length:1089 start_codon:yes stop_codon:yes gene_type:complete
MKAGEIIQGKANNLPFNPRPTLHFSLNYPIIKENHSNQEVKNRKYCIIEPAEHIKNQFYGGYIQDLIVLGDYTLSKDSIIFVPKSEEFNFQEALEDREVIFYDETTVTVADYAIKYIREKISSFDFEQNDILSSTKEVNGDAEIIFTYKKDQKKFKYKDLILNLLGGSYFGLHSNSYPGIINSILSGFATPLRKDDLPISNSETKKALICLNFHLKKLKEKILFFPASQEYIENWSQELYENIKDSSPFYDPEELPVFYRVIASMENKDEIHEMLENTRLLTSEDFGFLKTHNEKYFLSVDLFDLEQYRVEGDPPQQNNFPTSECQMISHYEEKLPYIPSRYSPEVVSLMLKIFKCDPINFR